MSEIFPILRRIQRYIFIKVPRPSYKEVVIFCHILVKLEFSRQIFAKHSNIKFDEHPSIGIRFTPREQTAIQTDMTNIRDAFRSFAEAPNKTTLLNES